MNVTVCGGGSLGHVVAGWLASKGDRVRVLTRRPQDWSRELTISLPEGTVMQVKLTDISDLPEKVIPMADIIILALPGYAIRSELQKIKDFVKPTAMVGCLFSSTGFFDQAFEILSPNTCLWGLQRVPFVARIAHYGHKANILSYKDSLNVAVERASEKDKLQFIRYFEQRFNIPVKLLANHYEASITNSNPLLHTSRLYTMFHDWVPGKTYESAPLFYEDWTDEASNMLAEMDKELFALLRKLPVTNDFLTPILKHYDSSTPEQMTRKIRSIKAFKGLPSPMIKVNDGWIPDLSNRYFVEDFGYGLSTIYNLAKKRNVSAPHIEMVFDWYKHLTQE